MFMYKLAGLISVLLLCGYLMGADTDLSFDTIRHGHSEVIVSIKLPDGGKVTRVTEALPGSDANTGSRVLKGYKMPDGTLVEVEILRNSDGTVTVRDLDNSNRGIDRHPVRMTAKEFIAWVKQHEISK